MKKDENNNLENSNNLDETKFYKAINKYTEDDHLEIPRFNSAEETKIVPTVNEESQEELEDDSVLVDNGKENIMAAEAELNSILRAQTNGNGDDPMANKNKKKGKLTRLEKFNIFLMTMTSFMIIGFIGALVIWTGLVSGLPELDLEALANQKSSILLDINQEPFFDSSLYSLDGTAHQDIPYMDMNQNVVDAFISIEDSRFFKHNGFDVPRFVSAMITNIKTVDFSQGGSTLTMQLIKTSHLSAAKNIKRKAQEITLSFDAENYLSKDEIFEYYVNKINYGAGNSRGIENAANYYFDKTAGELNISEAALLAGVVNAPNAYSPLSSLELATKRRDTVINLMLTHGYIDKEEADLAKSIKIENQLTDVASGIVTFDDNPYLDYVSAVIDEVKEVYGVDLIETPLTIQTYMDPQIQEEIAKIQNEENYKYPDAIMQSAVVVGDNETGQVAGIGAGRDSQLIKGFNRATDMYQQPGSTIKPLLSYALAFEHLGWSTSHVVEDKPVRYAGTDKILSNANNRYIGEVTLKDAVANSLNTPAYLTLLDVEGKIGRNAVATYLNESLGFSRVNTTNYNTQYAIGGSSYSISPMELFGAQAVMMNGGYYTKPHTVEYVITSDGEKIEDIFNYEKTRVISEETAFLVSEIEENNVSAGIINRMEVLGGRPYKVYAKTGTTDYGDTGLKYGIPLGAGKDQWMMASSKKYTSIVWMGFDKPIEGEDTYWTNAKYNANPLGKMNVLLLNAAHRNRANPGNVERPAGVSNITHVLNTFPYASPIEDIDEKYVTTGYINSKFNHLVDLDADGVSIEKLDGFKATLELNGNDKEISIDWSEYPEDGSVKSETYDISIPGAKATGTRLFDISWIFGPIQYEAEIKADGLIIETITSDSNIAKQKVNIPNDSKVTVCGYYKNNKTKGAETCVTVENKDTDQAITLPKFTSLQDLQDFANTHKLSPSQIKKGDNEKTTELNLDNTFAGVWYAGLKLEEGVAYKQSSLKKMTFEYRNYEYSEDE